MENLNPVGREGMSMSPENLAKQDERNANESYAESQEPEPVETVELRAKRTEGILNRKYVEVNDVRDEQGQLIGNERVTLSEGGRLRTKERINFDGDVVSTERTRSGKDGQFLSFEKLNDQNIVLRRVERKEPSADNERPGFRAEIFDAENDGQKIYDENYDADGNPVSKIVYHYIRDDESMKYFLDTETHLAFNNDEHGPVEKETERIEYKRDKSGNLLKKTDTKFGEKSNDVVETSFENGGQQERRYQEK